MISKSHRLLVEKLKEALHEEDRLAALYGAMKRGRDQRAEALEEFEDFNGFRNEIKAIKDRSISNLDQLLEEFSIQARKKGTQVFMAQTADQANDYVLSILKRIGGHLVAKSKSLTSEEIELNRPLEAAGYSVVETDLGERIIQLAKEKPFHLVFPAIHKTTQEVSDIFSQESRIPVNSDLKEIMEYVRTALRDVFLSADIGVSGANIGIAESGTVVVETNEGNGRLVASIPKVHVVIMGMEKIVSTFEEALALIRGHAVSATGQRTTTYVSFITGRTPLGSDSNRELHFIILDNGRKRMMEDGRFTEALSCIRCGACMNICAPYSVSGGHVFGHIYPGPIGIPWTANIHGLDKAKFAHLCFSCGLCKEICPAEIDIPRMISKVKEMDVQAEGQLLVNRVLEKYETMAPFASYIAPVWNWVMHRETVRTLMEKVAGIDRTRALPQFKRQRFSKWYRNKRQGYTSDTSKVVLFVDFFGEYIEPEVPIALVELLASANVDVILPPQKTSGYPFVAYGDLRKAEEIARLNVTLLYPYAKQGQDIISIEPTATYSLKYSYPDLLDRSHESLAVASRTFEASEYIRKLVQQQQILFQNKLHGKVAFHISCHERALTSSKHTIELLKGIGLQVDIRETGMCCGMAGTFGLKTGPLGAGLSAAIGKPLFELYKEQRQDYISSESGVCKLQLQQGTGLEVIHPLKLLRKAIVL
tara:strand:- start:4739 stop:6853 length:2115 start_codon:yes stop_codon:yes gene_type:complete